MTATPKKATPRKATPRKASPTPDAPEHQNDAHRDPQEAAPAVAHELEPTADPDLTLGTPPAAPQSDETPQLESGDGLGVSGQPAEYAPLPDRSEPRGDLRESPRPGTERYRELMAQADAQRAESGGAPEPLYAGTFALYANPHDVGGFVLVLIMADGTREEKRIPSAMVKLMQGGGGMMGKLTGLRKFIGNGLD